MDSDKKEFGKWWMWLLFLVLVSGGILTMTGYAGKWTGAYVERKVMETSIQRSEAFKARIATYKAQMAMIKSKLMTTSNEELRNQLQAQYDMLVVQIASAEAQK